VKRKVENRNAADGRSWLARGYSSLWRHGPEKKSSLYTPACFLTICLLSVFSLFGQNPEKVQNLINHKYWSFVENKGQLGDDQGNLLPGIKYYGHQGGVYLYCKPGTISFVFTRDKNENKEQISEATGIPVRFGISRSTHNTARTYPFGTGGEQRSTVSASRADLLLLNSNPSTQIIATDRQEYYENFYLANTPAEGITNVHTFKTVIYKNIYPNIDMFLKVSGNGLEYSFIVHPGGNPESIQMKWEGFDKTECLEDGSHKYSNSIGVMAESAPTSFVNGKEIQSSFSKGINGYGFKIGSYDKNKCLLIDPKLSWGTYFGGYNYESVRCVSADKSGNSYITGETYSPSGVATSGAYQTSAGSFYDSYVASFNSSGGINWATYIGGNSVDEGHGVGSDSKGNIYVTGYTYSSNNISYNGFQTSAGGLGDAFLIKFSKAGSIIWGTYLGVFSVEYSNCITIDAKDNIYIAGYASGNGLATSGVYQTSVAGNYDAFLAQFNSSGSRVWFTYFGGASNDYATEVGTDRAGNIYMTGYTYSTSGIASSGAMQTSNSGKIDAFLAKFNSSGKLSWSTYYGGANDDQAMGLTIDFSDNIYITGNTNSSGGIATAGAYQTAWGGTYNDGFLASFNSAGGLNWGTYYGGSDYDVAVAVSADAAGKVYITGWTTSTAGLATSGGYQTKYAGGQDAFIAKFNKTGARIWATYFGGADGDNASAICTNAAGYVFLAGSTFSQSAIATSGAYQTSEAGNNDAFLEKFYFPYDDDAGIDSLKNPTGNACAGNLTIKVNLQNYGLDTLSSAIIGWSVNGDTQTSYRYSGSLATGKATVISIGTYKFSTGPYMLKIWTSKPNGKVDSTPGNDTISLSFTSSATPSPKAGSASSLCKGDYASIGMSPVSGNTYKWTAVPSGFLAFSASTKVSPVVTTIYVLKETITATGCAMTDSVKITVYPFPKPNFKVDSGQCLKGNNFLLSDSSIISSDSIVKWNWNFGDSITSILKHPSHSFSSAGSYSILLKTTTNHGCFDTISKRITVYPNPAAGFAVNKTSSCFQGNRFIFNNKSSISSGYVSSMVWYFGDNDSSVSYNAVHSFRKKGDYNVKLKITSDNGCPDMMTTKLSVYAPTANFIVDKKASCLKTNNFSFTDQSTDTINTINAYSWDFGDGGILTAQNPTHVYSKPGDFRVVLKATTSIGCSDTISRMVSVYPGPVPVFKINSESQCITGNSFEFTDNSFISKGIITSWKYDFGDGNHVDSNNAVYSYAKTGDYIVTLKLVSDKGCADSISRLVKVNPLPEAKTGNEQSVCFGKTTEIGEPADSGHTYLWNSLPPGFTSTLSNPKISPRTTSIYFLKETITATGCSKMDSVNITVNPGPDPKWFLNYFGNTTYLHAKDSSLMNSSYYWDFGDGDKDSAAGHLAKHIYPKNKDYLVKLKVENSFGCINEYDSIVNIEVSGIRTILSDNLYLTIFPNPFSENTTIRYSLIKPASIRISISDITGKEIAVITDRQKAAGDHHDEINAESYYIKPGIYTLRISVDNVLYSRQLIKF
jgi:PKD repeat protein